MAMKQIGKAVLNPGTSDEVWGICESSGVALEATKKEVDNGEGDTVGIVYTNVGKKKFTGTFTPLAGTQNSPVEKDDLIGSQLDVKLGGDKTLKIYIDSAEFKRKKGDLSEFTIDGYYYPGVAAAPAQ